MHFEKLITRILNNKIIKIKISNKLLNILLYPSIVFENFYNSLKIKPRSCFHDLKAIKDRKNFSYDFRRE